MKNTRISYLYRDACNYKVHNEVVVEGELTMEQITEIIDCLDEEEYFIPSAVGLPECKFDEVDGEDDHPWFELEETGFELTDKKPDISITASELYESFLKMKGKWEKEINVEDLAWMKK